MLQTNTPARMAPALSTYEITLAAKPPSRILPVNLSPEEIRDMVLEVLG